MTSDYLFRGCLTSTPRDSGGAMWVDGEMSLGSGVFKGPMTWHQVWCDKPLQAVLPLAIIGGRVHLDV